MQEHGDVSAVVARPETRQRGSNEVKQQGGSKSGKGLYEKVQEGQVYRSSFQFKTIEMSQPYMQVPLCVVIISAIA